MSRSLALIFLLILAQTTCTAEHGPSTFITEADHQEEIASRLDLGHTDIMRTAMIMASDYPGDFNINQVNAIYRYLVEEKAWNYIPDPSFKEYYKYANQTLEDGNSVGTSAVGDCDDFAILMASLIESLHGSTRIIFAYDEITGEDHAYVELYVGEKGDPIVDEIKNYIKEDWGQSSVPGLSSSKVPGDDSLWLNLDYNATYPGGCVFGGDKATTEVAWISGNRTSPKIVPLIDSMDTLGSWKAIKDDIGSSISIENVDSRKGKAIGISYSVKEGGFVGITRSVDPKILSDLEGINFTYSTTSGPSILEMVLNDENNTNYSISWPLNSYVKDDERPRWIYLQGLFNDFHRSSLNNEVYSEEMLNQSNVRELKFLVRSSSEGGDIPNNGSIAIDQIRGVMKVSANSPWKKAEEMEREVLSLHLVSQAENLKAQNGTQMLRGLLAVEALRLFPSWETDQALREALKLMPRKVRVTQLDSVHLVGYHPRNSFLSSLERKTRKEISSTLQPRLQASSISSDGLRFAVAKDDILKIWDSRSLNILKQIEFGESIKSLAFSHNGSVLVIAGDHKAAFLNLITAQSQNLSGLNTVYSIAISDDGTKAAVWFEDGIIRIFDTQSKSKPIDLHMYSGTTINYEYQDLQAIKFSPDGKTLVLGSTSEGDASLWDCTSGKRMGSVNQEKNIMIATFSPDGSMLATSGMDEEICLWNTTNFTKLLKVPSGGIVIDLVFSLDGKMIAAANSKALIRIWEVESRKEPKEVRHQGVSKIAFSPNGKELGSAGSDNTARVWNVKSGDEIALMEHELPVRLMGFQNDSRIVTISDDDSARLWEIVSSQEISNLRSNSAAKIISFSQNGSLLSSISYDESLQKIWYSYKGRILSEWEFKREGNPEKTYGTIITGSGSRDSFAQLWNIKSKDILFSKSFSSDFYALSGAYLSHLNFSDLELWDLSSGRKLAAMPTDNVTIPLNLRFCAFCDNNSKLVTAIENDSNRFIQIWNISSRKENARISYNQTIRSLAVTPDCSRLFAEGEDGMQLLDLLSHTDLIESRNYERPLSMGISQDGSKIAIANLNGTIIMLDANSFQELSRFSLKDPNTVAFSADGRYLAAGGDDGIARIWDIWQKRELVRLVHNSPVIAVAFSSDGSLLATSCDDKTIKVWLWRHEDLIDEACSRIGRNLTEEEWRQYLGNRPYQETCQCNSKRKSNDMEAM